MPILLIFYVKKIIYDSVFMFIAFAVYFVRVC